MKEVFNILNDVIMAFIPLFVAIDVPGLVPIFLSLTQGMTLKSRRKLIIEATLTSAAVALVFLVMGKVIFKFLGITENDFRIGGGIVLLVLGVTDLLFSSNEKKDSGASVGVVPIGIPLVMGPGALTAIIIIVDAYGYWISMVSLTLNLLIVWLTFRHSDLVMKVMGEGGSKAFAKVAALFLVAIAVMMIRVGVQNILK
ncbi:MAG: MarC family protein [Bacteriovoracaceae bacterium]|nr:MarC family protein [Bacteroidota bacterium]